MLHNFFFSYAAQYTKQEVSPTAGDLTASPSISQHLAAGCASPLSPRNASSIVDASSNQQGVNRRRT